MSLVLCNSINKQRDILNAQWKISAEYMQAERDADNDKEYEPYKRHIVRLGWYSTCDNVGSVGISGGISLTATRGDICRQQVRAAATGHDQKDAACRRKSRRQS